LAILSAAAVFAARLFAPCRLPRFKIDDIGVFEYVADRAAAITVIIRRLELLRGTQPSRVKVISDNFKHAAEEVTLSEIEALCCLKFAWSPIR
jgi:hypothetical protein